MKTTRALRNGTLLSACLFGALTAVFGTDSSLAAEGVATNSPSISTNAVATQETPDEYRNWIEVGFGSTFISEDVPAFKRRHELRKGPFGGVEDFHFEHDIGKRGLLQIDGRGIFDNHDYGVKLDLSHPQIGYARGGYREFRTFYDGSGGYSPRSNAWVSIYDEDFSLDRRQIWFEGGITVPDWPVFSVRYSYETREGMKDSTIWGDYNLTQVATPTALRGITPTFRGIDEHRHIIDADMKHTIGRTDFGIGMRYERDDMDNSLNIRRRYGEPTLTRAVTQMDQTDTEIISPRAFVETRLHPNVLMTVAGAYTRLDTDIAGSRFYGTTYGVMSPVNQQNNDEGFSDLSGGSQVDQFVGNLNFMLTPWEHVALVPAVRIEHQDQEGESLYIETRVTNAASPASLQNVLNTRMRKFTDVTESLEARYTGVTNWVFYVRGEWLEGQGTLSENEFDVEDDGTSAQLQRETDSDRWVQKYTVGANWYPHRKANFGTQYYYRSRRNDYDHPLDSTFYNPPSTNNLYPAFIREHEFNTHDVNFRMTLRPIGTLTLVSRYDFQRTTYDTRGGVNSYGVALDEIESAASTSHIFSQSASWIPWPRLFLQASGSYAIEHTHTPASHLTGSPARLVQDAENDYWNVSGLIGYALSERTDLQTQYFYYRAHSYNLGNADVGLPYGAGAEQHGVTASLIHRLTKNLIWKLQYGFFTAHDQTSGGHNDYQAHLVYSSMLFRF